MRPDPLVARLRAAGCVFAEDEARLLRSAAAGAALEDLVARRVAGEPLEHLLGWAAFAGHRVLLTPGVFVPRRRTELLVELTASIVRNISDGGLPDRQQKCCGRSRNPVVVELCCGSGAVGAAIERELEAHEVAVEVWASDVDPVAVACARRNLAPERVLTGDLYDALPSGLRGRVDVVVANAPYVPTEALATMPTEARDHEPRVALDGGDDGVDLHRRVATGARGWLRHGGHLVVETSRAQSALTVAACEDAGLAAYVETDRDRDATAVVAAAP